MHSRGVKESKSLEDIHSCPVSNDTAENQRTLRLMKKQLLIAVCAAFVAAAVVLWMVKSPVRQAATFLHYLDNIVPGKTSESELLLSPPFKAQERQCQEGVCSYAFVAENKVLHSLHLAPETLVSAMVIVENGRVTEVTVGEYMFVKDQALAVALQEIPAGSDCSAKPCLRKMSRHGQNISGFDSATITFDGDSYLHKQLADAMNLECLSRVRGCSSQVEMAPLMAHASDFVPSANPHPRKMVWRTLTR
jgi:hypothetical protein